MIVYKIDNCAFLMLDWAYAMTIVMAQTTTQNRPGRRADDLRGTLERDILAGDLPPGERLDETGLAARFGVSRTPVREALLQLASSGLVEMRPRLGAVVAAMTVQQLLQMFEVMAEMEALCARLAARRMTPAERSALGSLHGSSATPAESGDVDGYYEVNRSFHESIYAGAHNAYLEEQTRSLRNRLSSYRRFQLNHPGRIDRSLAEHGDVVAAIVEGDADRAADAMRAHVAIQGDTFTDLVAALPPAYLQHATS